MVETNVLRSVIAPLVSTLGLKNIKVKFKAGLDAFVEYDNDTKQPRHMVLPLLGDDAPQEAVDVLHGFVDHEVGHVLFTDYSVTTDVDDPFVFDLFNAFEDPRIEECMKKRYRGSEHNLDTLSHVVLGDLGDFARSRIKTPEAMAVAVMLIARECWQQPRYVGTLAKLKNLQKFRKLIPFTDEQIRGCRSSEDTWRLAVELAALLPRKESKKPAKKTNPQTTEGESSGGSSKPTSMAPKKTPGDSVSTKDDLYKKRLKKYLEQHLAEYEETKEYRVPTTDEDEFVVYKGGSKDSFSMDNYALQMMDLSSLESLTNQVRTAFQRQFIAKSRVVWTSGYRKGRLCNHSLYKLKFGDDRVFECKTKAQSRSIAVSLMIDCSGSMTRCHSNVLAFKSAYVIGSVLESLGIKFEVLGFTTKNEFLTSEDRFKYARNCPLMTYLFKAFNERFDYRIAHRFESMLRSESLFLENCDGESLLIGYKRIMQRMEDRKIMMVLSDGFPAANADNSQLSNHLLDTVKEIDSKIDIIGIGINANVSVGSFYPKSMYISKIEDLPVTMLESLRKLILPN